MSDLSDELRDIDGVGEATAEAILNVVDGYTETKPENNYYDKAVQAAKANDYNTAGIYLLRYEEGQ